MKQVKLFIGAIFFTVGLFFATPNIFSQQQPSFSTQTLVFPDTSYLGSTATFTVTVKNLDTATYTGFVNVSVSADTAAFSVASLCSTPSLTITGLDSVLITCNIIFDSTYFNVGNNIVVVWSSGNAKAPADSVWDNVYLKTTGAGVGEHQNVFSFSLYPSLANNYLHIDYKNPDFTPGKIRVLDIFGREMQTLAVSKNEKKDILDVSALTRGIYFVEVSYGNHTSRRKFIKVE